MAGPHAEPEEMVLEKHGDLKAPMPGRLDVAVLTPKGPVAQRPADEVTAPGALGEFGVLPGHIPFLTALKPGVLTLRTGSERQVMAVGAGYVQVSPGNHVRVLVEQLELPDAIDIAAARADVEKYAAESKASQQGGAELAVIATRLAWAQARVDAHTVAHGGGDQKH